MTATVRVARVRRLLVATVALRALLLGGLTALLSLAAAAALDALFGLSLALRTAVPAGALAVGLLVAIASVWRARGVRALDQVALWLEDRIPELRYMLVTALEPAAAVVAAELEARVSHVELDRVARSRVLRSLLPLALGITAGVLLLRALPATAIARVTAPRSARAPADRAAPGDALSRIVASVTPPSYTGLAAQRLDDPARVSAVVGSRISIAGRLAGAPVRATAGDSTPVTLGGTSEEWTAGLTMPARPEVMRFRQLANERLLLLEPIVDSLPVVSLIAPVADTVLRLAAGVLQLHATLRDDFGLSQAWWELVISSGEAENFKFRTVQLGKAGLGHLRTAERTWQLVLDSLGLIPGDFVHLRAVAQDGNAISGPGLASSDTRTIRIARPSEYDSLSIEALPPTDPLKGLLSQRMLILLTEALERKRPRPARPEFLSEALKIAGDQNALRRQVGDIIFSRLEDLGGDEPTPAEAASRAELTPEQLLKAAEAATASADPAGLDHAEGESPVIAINRPLLEAYNAMWEAGRSLGVGDTRKALPHMYAALAAIQRARLAERIYLRGKAKPLLVDLAKVRLVGKKDDIAPAGRRPRTPEDLRLAAWITRFHGALEHIALDRGAAVDSLLLLRAELLGSATTAAGPLGVAIDALRAGRDATEPLVAARRALSGGSTARPGLGAWGPLR